jgi:leucyl-tRNA synthetase
MMIFVNEFTALEHKSLEAMSSFVRLLAPFAPHIAEELWSILGNTTSIFTYDWPLYDESKLIQSTVEIVIQVNSKIRARVSVSADATEEQLETIALAEEQVKKNLEGLTIRKKIIVPGKLVNFIAN